MSIFIKQKQFYKENVILWKKETEQLRNERDKLLTKLHEIEQYKEDYETLINETKIMKEKYENLIVKVERIFEEYKGKLSEVIATAEN